MCKTAYNNISIQQELAGYIRYKSLLVGLDSQEILASHELLRAAWVVRCIDEVLQQMDEAAQEYIRRRYLVEEPDKVTYIIMDVNMSQRTSNRRNTWFLDKVEELLR